MKNQTFYYVEACAYGRVTYESLNGNAYVFYAFKSKEIRNEFVKEKDDSPFGTYFGAITTTELKEALARCGYRRFHGYRYALVPSFSWGEHAVYEVIPALDGFQFHKIDAILRK